jgi:GR25 family glycosyltransferase involved in LPS biosynthesis
MVKTISLNMIVKNESHIIENTLEQLVNTFDFSYWVICDTGSTDNTQDIIKTFFKNKKINGELVEHEWKDFGHNRSLALDVVYNKSDYVLIFDADDSVHGTLILPELKADMYHMKLGKDFVYKRPLLVNNRLRWKFAGVLHEFLVCKDECGTQENIEGDYYIESGKSGARSLDKNKYEKDALILENAYNIEQDDSLKNRYAFYCAQSYMDSNNKLKSIEWYKKVINSDNWGQEKYYACLMIAKQLQDMETYDKFDVVHYLSLAGKYDNDRLEHLMRLVHFLHHKDEHTLVNALYLQNKNRKRIIHDLSSKLFVSIYDYDNTLEYYNSISSFYINDHTSGYECCKRIICNLIDTHIKNEGRLNITLNNLYYYKDCLKDETDSNILMTLFNKLNKYISTNCNNNMCELWNILFDKINFCEKSPLYIFKNKQKPVVFLSVTSCKRYNLFEKTINSILNNWLDIDKVDYWFCVDDNSNDADKFKMIANYPFFDFYFKNENEKGHRKSMNLIWDKLNELKPKYWIHLEDDFVFFDKMNYIGKAIEGIEVLHKYNINQILFNKCYAEIVEDYRISGYIDEKDFCVHEHNLKHNTNYVNNHYWPHYSFRPSLIVVDTILSLGNFDSCNQFFELDYANRWNDAGYKSGFFNKITNKHIGRLTKNRNDNSLLNAYDLNYESQFVKEKKYIKVVNLHRRHDRKEAMIQLFKSLYIDNYEFINAVDGKKLNKTDILDMFYGNDFANRRGFLGCALSHVNLWKRLLNDPDNNFYLIMEDDVIVSNNFKENIYKLKRVMDSKEIVFMGYSMYSIDRKKYNHIYNVDSNNIKVLELNKDIYTGGTFCYSINKKGAKHMLDYIDKYGIKHGIDYIMGKKNYGICYEVQPHISFSDWIERSTFNIENDIDTDIQSCCETIEIHDNQLSNDYNNLLSKFVFLPQNDQHDYDLYHTTNTFFEYMKVALNDEKCVAFNTLGFFKHKIDNLKPSRYYSDENDGIYIKLEHYNEYMKQNEKKNTHNEIIDIHTKNDISTNSNIKKIRVKLLCHWSLSKDIFNEWSNLFETQNSWKNIEFTYEDNDVDYYVIINYPYKGDYYEPSKSLIFQMEPWVYDESKSWGVKCWKEWSVPDESKFLYVGTHKKTLNNVQWQIRVPEYIPIRRSNKVISVLSAKNFDTGHNKRIEFIKYMENQNENQIDIFGRSNFHNFKNYAGKLLNDKKENHYINYKYCLAVENNMEHNYATEKIWESILCECLTFYWGCPNLEDYIDSDAFVRLDLNDYNKSIHIIKKAIDEDWWSQRIESIRREKHKLINDLGFLPQLKKIIKLD